MAQGWQQRSSTEKVVLAAVVLVAALVLYRLVQRGISTYEIPIVLFIVLIPSIIIHEVTHGLVALAFGDDTAKRAGRLTLNPLPHIDLIGTIIVPAILVMTGLGAFGWAKPVPVNVARLRSPRNQGLMVALAGPAVNIAMATAAGIAYGALAPYHVKELAFSGQISAQPLLFQVLLLFGYVNVILAVFNLIPIPPLDGSAILERMLPSSWWPQYLRIRHLFLPLILVVVIFAPGVLEAIFTPALGLWGHLLS
ncbi:MAG: site-2 protease family protein [Actinobacteria bacterium]|nr:site-2 protease family protein [Actinomycetota bacterium]MCL6095201.1 site-2 protease family protein [Actinomycetota bacterium]